MPRRPLVLVIALAAAFAIFTPSGPSSASQSPPKPALRFNDPVAMSSFSPVRTVMSHAYSLENQQGFSEHEWSGEPGLERDRFGTIYVSGVCCVVASSPVWVSRDNGKSFTELRTPAHVREWTVGAEGDIDVDDAGRVFFADTTAANILFTRWSAQGRKWDFTLPSLGVIPVDDRPWIAWTRRYLYMFINHDAFISVYRSNDGGVLWQWLGPLNWEGETGGFFPGHLAANRNTGALWVGGAVPGAKRAENLGSAVSIDYGKTFTQRVVYTPDKGEQISPVFTGVMTVDAAGYGYEAWSTWTKKGCRVHFAVSKDLGNTWSKPIDVGPRIGCSTFPWIDAGDKGEVALAYYHTPTTRQTKVPKGTDRPPYQDNVPDDAPWNLRIAYVIGADTKHPVVTDARVPFKTPMFLGPLSREPWDYIGVDLGTDNVVRSVFVEKFKDSAPQTWFVSSKPVFGP